MKIYLLVFLIDLLMFQVIIGVVGLDDKHFWSYIARTLLITLIMSAGVWIVLTKHFKKDMQAKWFLTTQALFYFVRIISYIFVVLGIAMFIFPMLSLDS